MEELIQEDGISQGGNERSEKGWVGDEERVNGKGELYTSYSLSTGEERKSITTLDDCIKVSKK